MKMLRIPFIIALSAIALCGADEHLNTKDGVAITVKRAAPEARDPNVVTILAKHPDGTVFARQETHNLRTNGGGDWQSAQMGGTPGNACTFIALTNDAVAPSAADTTLTSELATNGLARAAGTYATVSHSQYTVSHTWTASATQAVQKAGMFTASNSGTMCFEDAFTQITLNNGDQLVFVWTVNF